MTRHCFLLYGRLGNMSGLAKVRFFYAKNIAVCAHNL